MVFSDTWHLILEFIGAIHRDYDAICNNNDSVNYSHCDNWFKLLKWLAWWKPMSYKGEKINGNIRYPAWYKRRARKASKFKYGWKRGVKVELLRVVIIFLGNYRINRSVEGGSCLKRVASNVVCSRRCVSYPRYRRRKVGNTRGVYAGNILPRASGLSVA